MKKLIKITALAFALILVLPLGAFAATPYSTYTYSIDGLVLDSPDAYVPSGNGPVNSATLGLELGLREPTDIEADSEGNIYITDKGNNRIVVTNEYYELKYTITDFVNDEGVEDTFNTPVSTFVVDEGKYRGLYVCDKANGRILVFNQENGDFIRVIGKPESDLMGDADYAPISCVVDKHGRIYAVSEKTTAGIIVMTSAGDFINFIGAPKVSVSALEALIKLISPGAAATITHVPTTYSNLDIDKTTGEFVYATIIYTADDEENQLGAITSKNSDYAPVRLLNANGTDIMNRNGFFAPAGEVAVDLASRTKVTASNSSAPVGVSNIMDVASGPNGVWSIIDSKRSKVYTYDSDGNLLYIFGDMGAQFGNIQKAIAITYQGSNIVVLDVTSASFTVYRRTEYAEVLDKAIGYQNTREYEKAVEMWDEVLARNNNFDTAYVTKGKALYRDGNYEEAIKYFQNAYDVENYATAYKEIRSSIMATWFPLLIIVIVVLAVLLVKVLGWAGKVNKRATTKHGKKTFLEEFLYGFHLIFHPFDGYWDLKHEKRGSLRAAITIVIITVLSFYYQSVGQGYYFNPQGITGTIFSQITSVLIPIMLFVIANWCFTTLFDGEGSFKDIFIATAYGLYPLPFFIIVSTILTNVLVGTEGQITSLLVSIAYIWMGMLIVVGMQVTHDYSMGKNILTIIATIVGMVFIMFIAVLFTSLISKMVSLVTTIVSELSYR
ncbi:MAG: YIP1 family protein [Clostridia bacterium]|nr:YIP1 family protein [Clostridia bacterium]